MATLPRITKMDIRGGVGVQPRTTFPLTRKKSKHSKKSKKEKRKRRYSSSFSSATSTTSDIDSSDNEPAKKRFLCK